ncbi:MAG: aspartate kinase [Firmicutes bacterium]|nr:aspartate kinase [Bacillota bacterium]
MKVCKFGGTSMANAETIAKVAEIIKTDKSRKFVVVSAPGKRRPSDTKVTDLLYACADSKDFDEALSKVKERFDDIIKESKIKLKLDYTMTKKDTREYLASRGEYLAGKVMAQILGYEFIDAAEIIKFDSKGNFLAEVTHNLCKKRFAKVKTGAVIPGFYGSDDKGDIKTFSRGGSDVTGAIIARAIDAEVYENWTDVDGFLKCDPRIVDSPKLIDMLTYKELRELSYMGANVLHPEAIFPVRASDISINIRNTFNPKHEGTMIVPTKFFERGDYKRETATITGIAGKKDFVAINVEKSMMNNEVGFARRLLQVLEDDGVSVEHMPTGIDTICVVIDRAQFAKSSIQKVVDDVKKVCKPDRVTVVEDIALIAVVGHGMTARKGTAADVCGALADADVNIRMIDQGSSELNIIVAVDNKDFETALKALYGKLG